MHQTVRITCVIAGALWTVAFALTLAGTLTLAVDRLHLAMTFYAHDMLAIGAAAVMSMKATTERQTRTIVNHMEIGQDAATLTALPRRSHT